MIFLHGNMVVKELDSSFNTTIFFTDITHSISNPPLDVEIESFTIKRERKLSVMLKGKKVDGISRPPVVLFVVEEKEKNIKMETLTFPIMNHRLAAINKLRLFPTGWMV